MNTVLTSYLDSHEAQLNQVTETQLLELLASNVAKVTVRRLTREDLPELKGEVLTIRNEAPVVDALLKILGVPEDGSTIRIRTGFMCYDKKNRLLFFSSNKYDLPQYIKNQPKNESVETQELTEAKKISYAGVSDWRKDALKLGYIVKNDAAFVATKNGAMVGRYDDRRGEGIPSRREGWLDQKPTRPSSTPTKADVTKV